MVGNGIGAKSGILFKNATALENAGKTKIVALDKTGTITEGNFVLQKTVTVGNTDEDTLLRLAASCEQVSTHPIANSIVTAAKEKGMELTRPST